jgi:hypothetical protein
VLTNPLLVLYYLQGQVIKNIKVEEGKGRAKGRVKRRKGKGKRGSKRRFERRGGKGRERVIKVNKAQ